ncbi:YbfB/YjiJ family MFS transporter [Burkholderia sp. BCC1995]|uniref:YbfB/YjiJ family MFS transporter n=2 Tax=unclassified Burkholderia TaxID=2613784 RepID=UPI002ABE705C|nr:YbfB/YjiJ family MFS transporter [Burkholderia sp. BCC1995]
MPNRGGRFRPDAPIQHIAAIIASAVSLAIAMGIGRFVFTSLLPVMISDGMVDLRFGGHLAMANYIGYLAGAMLCIWLPRGWSSATIVRWGLVVVVGLTAGMIVPSKLVWLLLRFLSGVASAVVLVHTSRWCLMILAGLGKPALGSLMFAGVGLGIALSGLIASAMIGADWGSAAAWAGFSMVGAILLTSIWRFFHPSHEAALLGPVHHEDIRGASGSNAEMVIFSLAYGFAGFGYIITATFLPVIARTSLPSSHWLDLFWPVFGMAAALGSIIAAATHSASVVRRMLIACHLLQAVGVVAAVFWPTVPGFLIGSILAGIPFTAINYFSMQEVRRLRPMHAARYMGILTALYGIGQISGPSLVTEILRFTPDRRIGFDFSLEIAGAVLAMGAVLYFFMELKWPVVESRRCYAK